MEEGEIPYNHEEDVRGQYISVGNVEIETNGHREDINTQEFVESMRILNIELQGYKENNERLLSAHEQQNELNTQLVQSLNMLQMYMKIELSSMKEK